MNKGIKTSLLAIITVLAIVLLMPASMAYDHDQTYDANSTFFVVEDVRSPDSNDRTVEVWINTSVGVTNGLVKFCYDSACADVTSATINTADWDSTVGVTLLTGETWLSFSEASGSGNSGTTQIAELTIHCNGSSSCCGTVLGWMAGGSNLNYVNGAGIPQGPIPGVNWANGTYLCGNPLIVEKTVYDSDAGTWVDEIPSAQIDDELRFRINVTSGPCCDHTDLVVTDTLPTFLTFNDSEIPFVHNHTDDNVYYWNFSALNKDEMVTIEFNATVNAYGVADNEAAATATCTDLGLENSAGDMARITAAPAYDAIMYLNPQVSGAPYCNTTDVEVWVNSSVGFQSGQILLNYSDGCAEVVDWTQNIVVFPHEMWDTSVDGTEWIQFSRNDEITGDYLIGTLTIHCNSTDPCLTILDIVNAISEPHGALYSTVFDGDTVEIKTDSIDGNFTCGTADLIVDDIVVNRPAYGDYERPFGPTDHPGAKKEINTLHAEVTNDGNSDIVGLFDVCFYIDGVLFSVETVDGLAAGASIWVDCSKDWTTFAGIDYVLNVTADCTDAVAESNETNNALEESVRSVVHGLKGGNWQDGRSIANNITTEQGNVNLRYSAGNSTYWGAGDHVNWTTYAVEWDDTNISIPNAATIKHARLYVYYTFGRITGDYYAGVNPEFELDFNDGNIYTMADAVSYTDIKGTDWSSFYNFPGGMLAYDVTDDFDETENLAIINNLREPSTEEVSMNGMVLIVIYEHENEPERIIYVNEGFDKLAARTVYGTNSTEATAYGVFNLNLPPDENLGTFAHAWLVSIAADASQVQGAHAVAFNGEKWTGEEGSPILEPLAAGLYLDKRDVRTLLEEGDNIVEYQSVMTDWGSNSNYGDYFDACNAFLILEKGKKKVISVEPEYTLTLPQSQFDIDIKVDPYTAILNGVMVDVYSASYELHYDTSVLRAATVNKGPFLSQDGATTQVVYHEIDEANGIIRYAETIVGSGTPGVHNAGILSTIHFSAIGSPGAISNLNITDVVFVDSEKVENTWYEVHDGWVELFDNNPPVSIPTSKFWVNNVATKYNCYADLCACQSYDPDNSTGFDEGDEIVYTRWAFGDGEYGTSEGAFDENCQKLHKYTSWNWVGGEDGSYEPFLASLTVTDDGDPDLSGTTYFDVVVYIAGDANGDGIVNVIDAAYVGKHWEEDALEDPEVECCHYWAVEQADKADLNNDQWVNLFDMAIVGANWDHIAWV